MAKKPLPCPTLLRLLLDYNPETGKLFWKPRKPWMFRPANRRTADHICANWNSKYAGAEAYTSTNNSGYRQGGFLGYRILSHKVIWAIINGRYPDGDIDHINGDRADNRIVNLRSVSRQENLRNQCRRIDNKSGYVGVHWSIDEQVWVAQVCVNGRPIHLGRYSDLEHAVVARKAADRVLGFSATHGMTLREKKAYGHC